MIKRTALSRNGKGALIVHFSKLINIILKIILFTYLLAAGLCCCAGFPLDAESGGYSLVEVRGLLLLLSPGPRVLRLQ